MSLLMLKSIITTVVVLLAVSQALMGLRMTGHLRRWPAPVKTLRIGHRLLGDAVLLLTLSVALICVTHLSYGGYSLRVPVHAALGTVGAAILLGKVVVARRFRRYLRYARILGGVAGLSLLGCFWASALWYFRLVW
jgi:hypothetical protein